MTFSMSMSKRCDMQQKTGGSLETSLGLTVIPEDVMNRGRQNTAGEILPLYQIGIIFDEVDRNVVSWEVE